MIARPSWERPLRRRLRKKLENRGQSVGWIQEHTGPIALWFVVQIVLMTEGEQQLGARGGATGIGIGAGIAGAFIANCLRDHWQHQAWLTEWTPASHATVRRIQSRELFSRIVPILNTVLLTSAGIAALSPATGVVDAVAAAWIAMLAGFLLAGGRTSTRILFASAICVAGYSLLSPWLHDDTARWVTRLLKGAAAGWLPVLPWSNFVHGSPGGSLSWLVPGAALVISLREWRRSWIHAVVYPARLALTSGSEDDENDENDENDEDVEDVERDEGNTHQEPATEDQRKQIRQQVAFGWVGMAGYLPRGPMPWIDRLIWRWLTPRQRMISTLGSHDAFGWFAQTKWAAFALAVLAGLAWLWQWIAERPGFSKWFNTHGYWGFVGLVALAAYAILSVWPSRRSRFKPWLESMRAQGIGQFPSFALLPVCPGDWLRAAAKEWAVRSAWMAGLWTLAIAAALPAFSFEKSAATIIAWLLLPWLLGAALFPLSAMNRLVRAVSGPMLRSQGFSRTIPSILFGVLCPTATAAAAIPLGIAEFLIALVLLSVAAGTGWISLALTLNRCRHMRFDLKPKPLH